MTDPSSDLLKNLLEPEDDHAWKLAVGATLAAVLEQTKKTNGRVNKLEADRNKIAGGLLVISAIVVPLFLKVVVA
jgi:hypothetical protein